MSSHSSSSLRPPDGGVWFPRIAPALEHAAATLPAPGVVMCWECCGTRVFGSFADHATMWAAVRRSPQPQCGYEIIRELDRCKLYSDLEMYCPLAERDAVAPALDHALRVFLELFRAAGGGGALTVLDGTRTVTLPAAKANEWFGTAETSTHVDVVKFSYHVIVQGLAFPNAGAAKQRVKALPPFVRLVPDGSRLHALVSKQPNLVDLSVFYKNKNFRMLGSCKSTDTATPFKFHPVYNEHTDELDALVTYAAHLPLASNTAAVSAIEEERPRKRMRAPDAAAVNESISNAEARASVVDVQAVINANRPRLDALQGALRALFVHYGDAKTEIRYLQAVDGPSLRWETRNQGTRPCLLNCTEHTSNNALLSLEPLLTATGGHGIIKDAYDVRYKCLTERCGKPTGVIGTLAWDPLQQRYQFEVIFPPRLLASNRRPATFRPRSAPLPNAATRVAAAASANVVTPPATPAPAVAPANVSPFSMLAPSPPATPAPTVVSANVSPFSILAPHRPATTGGGEASGGGGDAAGDDEVCDEYDDSDGEDPVVRTIPKEAQPHMQSIGSKNDEDDVDPEDPELNTYELVKQRFERYNFHIEFPFSYAYVRPGTSEPMLCNDSVWRSRNIRMVYYEKDLLTREWIVKPFIRKWMLDRRAKSYHALVVDPCFTNPKDLNFWPGILAARLPPIPDQQVPTLIAPFVRHVLEVLCNDDDYTCQYILDLMASMVQRPHAQTGVVVSLFGRQGCGKGILLAALREYVLGPAITYQTPKAEDDLMGRFANGAFNKVMVQVDEVGSMHEFDNLIKNLVTNSTIRLERKGKDCITVKNLTNLW